MYVSGFPEAFQITSKRDFKMSTDQGYSCGLVIRIPLLPGYLVCVCLYYLVFPWPLASLLPLKRALEVHQSYGAHASELGGERIWAR